MQVKGLLAYYQIRACIASKEQAIAKEQQRAGRFILATNVLDANELSNDDGSAGV